MTEKPSANPKLPPPPPPPPLKIRILTAAISAIYDLSRRSDGTINRCLLSYLDPVTRPNPCPVRHVTSSDVIVDPNRNLWFRLFLPSVASCDSTSKIPTVVFFHGGGFAFLSPASRAYDAVCRRFARRLSAVVVSVNYRLSPEHKFPAPYEDGIDVLRFLDDVAAGVVTVPDLAAADLSSTFLMGDSAGANIVHHVAARYVKARATWRRVRVAGMVLIQPFFGGEERTESEVRLKGAPLVSVERTDWLWKAFLPEGASKEHEGSNFKAMEIGEEEEGWPPGGVMVVVGGWDPLQDRQREYAEWVRGKAKEVRVVEYACAVHAFYVLPGVKESGLLIEEIKEFMEAHKSK